MTEEALAIEAAEDTPDIDRMLIAAKVAARSPKPTLAEMVALIGFEAACREGSARARLIDAQQQGFVAQPSRDAMRTIAVLDAVHVFLEACQHRPRDVIARLKKLGASL